MSLQMNHAHKQDIHPGFKAQNRYHHQCKTRYQRPQEGLNFFSPKKTKNKKYFCEHNQDVSGRAKLLPWIRIKWFAMLYCAREVFLFIIEQIAVTINVVPSVSANLTKGQRTTLKYFFYDEIIWPQLLYGLLCFPAKHIMAQVWCHRCLKK